MPIAEYRHPTIDCPDPLALAKFYALLADLEIEDLKDFPLEKITWLTLQDKEGRSVLAFARVDNYVEPTWPEGNVPQQSHLEFSVPDLDIAEAQAIAIGARKPEFQPGEGFRVYLDPVGHPFCLILNYSGINT